MQALSEHKVQLSGRLLGRVIGCKAEDIRRVHCAGLGAMDSEETTRIKKRNSSAMLEKDQDTWRHGRKGCKGEHVRSVRGLNKSTAVRMHTSQLTPRPGKGKVDGA